VVSEFKCASGEGAYGGGWYCTCDGEVHSVSATCCSDPLHWAGSGHKSKIDIHGTLSASVVLPPCIFSRGSNVCNIIC
jgi:hypothetical protein